MFEKERPPRFAKIGSHKVHLLLNQYIGKDEDFWVHYKQEKGRWIAWAHGRNMRWIHRKPIVEISEEEYNEE